MIAEHVVSARGREILGDSENAMTRWVTFFKLSEAIAIENGE